MTREENEAIGIEYHYEEVLGLPRDTDAEGFYPGEKEWLEANGITELSIEEVEAF